jgi:hypothetical protein
MRTRARPGETLDGRDRMQRTIDSGVKTADWVTRLGFLVSDATMRPFSLVQRLFYEADLGDGYVATAVKPSEGQPA